MLSAGTPPFGAPAVLPRSGEPRAYLDNVRSGTRGAANIAMRMTRSPWVWPVAVLLLLFIGFLPLLYAYRSQSPAVPTVPVTQAIQEVQAGQVREVVIEGDRATLTLNDGSRQTTNQPTGDDLLTRAVVQRNQADPAHPITLKYQEPPSGLATALTLVLSILLSLLPLVLLVVLIVLAARAIARASSRDPYERLARIADLRDRGVLTEEEFQREKRRLLR